MSKAPIDILLDRCDWKPTGMDDGGGDGIPFVTHTGELNLGGVTLTCHQLSDGTRVFDEADIVKLFDGLNSIRSASA